MMNSTQIRLSELSKLNLWLLGVCVAYLVYVWRLEERWVNFNIPSHDILAYNLDLMGSVYLWRGIFVSLELIAFAAWVFEPVKRAVKDSSKGLRDHPYSVAFGLMAVVSGAVFTFTYQGYPLEPALRRLVLGPGQVLGLGGVAVILLFCFLLPTAMEVVFRGIAQTALNARIGNTLAIIVSAFLSATLWTAFSFPLTFLAGLVAGWLYLRTGNLFVAILTNSVTIASLLGISLWFYRY